MPSKDINKRREASRKHYATNKDSVKQKVKTRKRLQREMIYELKSKTPCSDCLIKYPPYVMEFDHIVEKGIKVDDISHMIGGKIEDILLEIEKCEIVCANCHRKRSWKRLKDSGKFEMTTIID